MKILDKINFQTKLNIEIKRAETDKSTFSLVALSPLNSSKDVKKLLESIIAAQVRKTDVVAIQSEGVYIIVLVGTNKQEAQLYLDRLIKKAVVEDGLSLRTSVEQYKEDDEELDILLRLYMKLR